MTAAGEGILALSRWHDEANAHRHPEALLWLRVAKAGEEAGEAIDALIGWTGGNPRKGICKTRDDVEKELLDTAVAALCAVAHLHGNTVDPLPLLEGFVLGLVNRAAAQEAPQPPMPPATPSPGLNRAGLGEPEVVDLVAAVGLSLGALRRSVEAAKRRRAEQGLAQ